MIRCKISTPNKVLSLEHPLNVINLSKASQELPKVLIVKNGELMRQIRLSDISDSYNPLPDNLRDWLNADIDIFSFCKWLSRPCRLIILGRTFLQSIINTCPQLPNIFEQASKNSWPQVAEIGKVRLNNGVWVLSFIRMQLFLIGKAEML